MGVEKFEFKLDVNNIDLPVPMCGPISVLLAVEFKSLLSASQVYCYSANTEYREFPAKGVIQIISRS